MVGRAGVVLVLIVAVVVALTSGSASASCDGPVEWDDEILGPSNVAFVGLVERTTDAGTWADVRVEEVWKGSVPERVTIAGGPPQPDGGRFVMTSISRTYIPGERYLFSVTDAGSDPVYPRSPQGGGARYTDNACSATRPFNSASPARPSDAHPPIPGSALVERPADARARVVRLAAIGIGIAAVTIGIGLVLIRRRHRRRTAAPPTD